MPKVHVSNSGGMSQVYVNNLSRAVTRSLLSTFKHTIVGLHKQRTTKQTATLHKNPHYRKAWYMEVSLYMKMCSLTLPLKGKIMWHMEASLYAYMKTCALILP